MDWKKQAFRQAMQKKRQEKQKVKDYYESEKGKQDLAQVRTAYNNAIKKGKEIKKILPF